MRAGDSELWQEAEAIQALHPKRRELRGDVAAIVEAVQREADKPGGFEFLPLSEINAPIHDIRIAGNMPCANSGSDRLKT